MDTKVHIWCPFEKTGGMVKHARRILPTLAAVTAMMLLANRMVSDKETSLLEAQGAIGPGAQLQLNTAQGPMLLTVDSEITPQGYVHAYGQNDGQYYAGYIKLSPTNVQAQQILSQAPTFAQQQLMADPINRPQSETIYTARARQAAAAASNNRNVQLSVAANGMVRLNGQVVVPSDARTTSVLRLMEKQAQLRQEQVARTQLLAQIAVPGGDGDLNAALASAKARVHLLEEDKAKIDGTTMLAQVPFCPTSSRSRCPMHLATQSCLPTLSEQSHSRRRAARRKMLRAEVEHIARAVEKISERQRSMQTVVNQVKKVMRYDV